MTTATPPTALATIQPVFIDPERLALAGYGDTGRSYAGMASHLQDFR